MEALLLLFLAHLQPVLEQVDAAVDNHAAFEGRALIQKALLLRAAGEAHHALHAGAVVPTAVKDHDLARGGKVTDVALQVKLGLFPVRGRRQRHHAEHPRTDPLGQRADTAAFSRRVAPFKHDDDALALRFHPILERAQLGLKFAQCFGVMLAFHPHLPGV